MAGNFGMMNEAYFVGKNVLLDWINAFLDVRVEKVEQMCTGALYCNLFDALHPGNVPMKKVDFTCKYEYEYVNNWKLLQTAFEKIGIEKPIPVQKLIKGRYQDNLEFFQWMYKYAHEVYNGDPDNACYDAVDARSKSKGGKEFSGSCKSGIKPNAKKMSNASRISATDGHGNAPQPPVHGAVPVSGTRPNSARFSAQPKKATPFAVNSAQFPRDGDNGQRGRHYNDGEDVTMAEESHAKFNNQRNMQIVEIPAEIDNITDNQEREHLKQENEVLREKCLQLEADHQELTNVAKEIEKERDFYFRKVCEVEELCKSYGDQALPLLEKIYNSLYQTCDDAIDVPPNENEPPNVRNGTSTNVLQDSLSINKNDFVKQI